MRSAASFGRSQVLFPLWFPARRRDSVTGEWRHDARLPHVQRAGADLTAAQGRETGRGADAVRRGYRSYPRHHREFFYGCFSRTAGGARRDHLFRWWSIQDALRGVVRRGRAEARAAVWTTAACPATVFAAPAEHGVAAATRSYTFLLARPAYHGGTRRPAECHREHHPLARQGRPYKPVVASRNVKRVDQRAWSKHVS